MTDDVKEIVEEKVLEMGKKYVVPENYLESEIEVREEKMLDEIRI